MDERNRPNPINESDEETESVENNKVNLSSFFETAQEAVERHTHCPICSSNLHFTHMTDFSQNLTHECVQCPECGIRLRKMTHRLQ